MSDAIKEAMKECGLEELLNFGDDMDFDSSLFDSESETPSQPALSFPASTPSSVLVGQHVVASHNQTQISQTSVNPVLTNPIFNQTPVNPVLTNQISFKQTSVNPVLTNPISFNQTSVNPVLTNPISFNQTSVNPVSINQISFNQTPVNQAPISQISFNQVPINQMSIGQASVNNAPVFIRLGNSSQPQIIKPPQITLGLNRSSPSGMILGGNARPQSFVNQSFVNQSAVSNVASITTLPSHNNGRIIKVIPKVGPSPNISSSIRPLVNNGTVIRSGHPLVLNSNSIVPLQNNVQTTNIMNINRQGLPIKPMIHLSVPNQNGIRINPSQLAPTIRSIAARPNLLQQNAPVLTSNLPTNIPIRVVTRPNLSQLSQRPITVLNQNIASSNISTRMISPHPPANTINFLNKNTPSSTNQSYNLPDQNLVFTTSIPLNRNVISLSNLRTGIGTTSVKIEPENPNLLYTSIAHVSSQHNHVDVKPDSSSLAISINEAQKNQEEKKAQTSEIDINIWAALDEMAESHGLNKEDLGLPESSNLVKQQTFINDFPNIMSTQPQTLQSRLPMHNKIPGIQNVVLGEKSMKEFMGGPSRPPFQALQQMVGNPRPFMPQMRPNGFNLIQSILPPKTEMKEEELEEELCHAETFAEYMPTKLDNSDCCKHPDPVVESASLSSVEAPDITHKLRLPRRCWATGALSAVQLESITYACQKHTTSLPTGERAGFLIGDGAGVGKGRIISGIIYENFLNDKRRALWLSVSNDLKVDAERDLRDIGAEDIKVYALNKFKYDKIGSRENGKVKSGVIFATYSSLIGQSKSNKYDTRLKQLLQWLGKVPGKDPVIVFDECHKAKNLFSSTNKKGTKTSEKVLELQNKLINARVVYASATGATEPRNMGYMIRLGLWGTGTPFNTFNEFVQMVEKRGVGAMELIAMEMKQRGNYIARQLSFKGVSFHVEDVDLNDGFIEMYNKSVQWWVDARDKFLQASDLVGPDNAYLKKMWGQFWSSHQRFFKYLCISAKIRHCVNLSNRAIAQGKSVVIGLQSTGESRMKELVEKDCDELDDFVSTAKEVLKNLVEKYFPCSRLCSMDGSSPKFNSNNKRLADNNDFFSKNKKLKKNSEASESSESSDDDDDDDDKNVIDSDESDYNPFAQNSDEDSDEEKSPVKKKKTKKKKKKKKESSSDDDDEEDMERMCDKIFKKDHEVVDDALVMKHKLLRGIERLGDDLPPNALDDLINQLGGPARVAEMTGRKGRLVSGDGGMVRYEKRNDSDASLEAINLSEKQKFMDGKKLIAIISEAASSGISLQADRRAVNQRRRVHITLELPWSADRAIQQFGRTHRSNQVSAPEYVFLISKLAGERRFASTVAKRLESLGALTQGDRRAAETRDLSQFNIDNKFGHAALDAVLKSVIGAEKPLVSPCPDPNEKEAFFKRVCQGLAGVGILCKSGISYAIEKDSSNITKFLNRILGMEVEAQNSLFSYFTNVLGKVIMDAKKEGKWDSGILDIGSSGEKVEEVNIEKFKIQVSQIMTSVFLHTIKVDRGMTWTEAENIMKRSSSSDDGLYKLQGRATVKDRPLFIIAMSKKDQKNGKLFEIYKPNNGKQATLLSHKDLKKNYVHITLPTEEMKKCWNNQYEKSLDWCLHHYEKGYCQRPTCEVGKRIRIYHVLSGSVLGVWTNMERFLGNNRTKEARLQVIRLKTNSDKRIVGVLIHDKILNHVMQVLNPNSENSSLKTQFSSSTSDIFDSKDWRSDW